MTEFIIFVLLTVTAGVAVVFATKVYGASDERPLETSEPPPARARSKAESRSGADRRSGWDRRQVVRYEPQANPRRAGTRRRTYEELVRRSSELSSEPTPGTSRSRPPYPG